MRWDGVIRKAEERIILTESDNCVKSTMTIQMKKKKKKKKGKRKNV